MNVLVPIDGSTSCENTLDWIAHNLDKQTARYFLLYVIPKTFPEVMDESEQVEEAVRILKEARWFLEQKGCEVERAEYVLGDPVDGICRYADEVPVDEVLIGSHGAAASHHKRLGSVVSGVFDRCRAPVFVFRNLCRYRVPQS